MKRRGRIITTVLLTGLLAASAWAEDLSPAEFVARYGRPLAEDRVYYRWQSTTSGENLVRAMTELALGAVVDPKRLAHLGALLADARATRDVFAPPVLARADALGLGRFRTRTVLSLAEIAPSKAERRRLVVQALDAAVNPIEVIHVAHAARALGAMSEPLRVELGRTLRRYDANGGEYKFAHPADWRALKPPGPAPFECVASRA